MANSPRILISGTGHTGEKRRRIKEVEPTHVMEVLLLLRDQGAAPLSEAFTLGSTSVKERKHLSHEELLRNSRASDGDIDVIKAFAIEYDLAVLRVDSAARTIVLAGKCQDVGRAFDIKLHHYQIGKEAFHSHDEDASIPPELKSIVLNIFGLDNRTALRRPGFSAGSGPPPPPVDDNTKPPAAFANLYSFPSLATGKGQCIAIVEFDGGFDRKVLDRYLRRNGVKEPDIVVREVGKGRNNPINQPDEINADTEVYMDIEIVASLAPDAKIVVYFGENTEQGWIETVSAAIHDTDNQPSALSISWGMAEGDWKNNWGPHAMQGIENLFLKAAHLGITVCCSSGDFGVYETQIGEDPATRQPFTVPYPASSPLVLACGGTLTETSKNRISREAVWNQSDTVPLASAGGVSRYHELPPYQANAGVPRQHKTGHKGRGLPDVAANASTDSGYLICSDNTEMSMGGTSAAAPLWASLIACLNESLGSDIGYLTPLLYTGGAQEDGALQDVVDGDNKIRMISDPQGYEAQAGWDACTGLGTPRGDKLLNWLNG
ncbi:MAG: S53 family peptidase [Halioglobus sp.]